MTFLKSSLGARPTTGFDDLAALEEHDGRNAADLELDRRVRVLIDVQLADRDLSRVLRRQLVDGRAEPFARAAPLGPEVHKHRLPALKHGLVEVRIGEGLHVLGCH